MMIWTGCFPADIALAQIVRYTIAYLQGFSGNWLIGTRVCPPRSTNFLLDYSYSLDIQGPKFPKTFVEIQRNGKSIIIFTSTFTPDVLEHFLIIALKSLNTTTLSQQIKRTTFFYSSDILKKKLNIFFLISLQAIY